MKKIIFVSIISCFYLKSFSQSTSSIADVYSAQSIMFYGYDYTKLRIADATKIGQPLKNFFPNLTIFLSRHIPPKKMNAWLRKDSVVFDMMAVNTANERINNGKIAVEEPISFPVDSLPGSIKKLEIKESSGVGSLIVFECFNRAAKTASAYLVIFDISTGSILYTKHASFKNQNGYNYISDWKATAFLTVEELYLGYMTDRRAFLKAQKSQKKQK